MAQFLITTEINLLLEKLIKDAREQLVLVSPYLKLNDRMRELLQDKNGQIAEVLIVYGKHDLHESERQWFAGQQHIKISFCKNLHAKCYLSEHYCIVTSMNLYDFSQVNNNEIGIGIHSSQDKFLYSSASEEVQRLIRIGSSIEENKKNERKRRVRNGEAKIYSKLTTANLAAYFGKSTGEMFHFLIKHGCLERVNGHDELTEKGRQKFGGEKRKGRDGSFYFLWNNPALKPKK